MSTTASTRPPDTWASGTAYERYVGRWSRIIAREFLNWLGAASGLEWLDVGCGTGALSQTILGQAAPSRVKGIDRSESFIAHARQPIQDERVEFQVGDAQVLPEETASYDVVVSGFALNFIPQPKQAVSEMMRVVKPGGIVALYIWDYATKLQFMRHFWNAAAALDPNAFDHDEGRRFPLCQPKPLAELFESVGVKNVQVRAIDIDTNFKDWDDYWSPFLGGQGSAPSYAMSLSEEKRAALAERIRAGLPFAIDGSIPLVARAWAVRGVRA
ncbi:MAG: methyltransferase domain-containing protein [Chloroflexi bacterium]|nr:methyltransferase domain-containing protein [Chloroflexota bacterium]